MGQEALLVTDSAQPGTDRSSLNPGELVRAVRQALSAMDRETRRQVIREALGEAVCRKIGLAEIPPETKLSVVVPVYNERDTIRQILERIQAVPIRKEIILVDDYSTDGTREILKEIEEEQKRNSPAGSDAQQSGGAGSEDSVGQCASAEPTNTIEVVFHEKNRGKGAALRTGFRKVSGTIVIVQDADLEYNPDEYPELIEPIIEGRADVVYGSRFIGETHRVLYFWHYLGNKLLTMVSNMFTGLNLTDMETCYKVFRREVIDEIAPTLKSDRFGFEPEVTAKIARRRLRVYERPISYSGREYSEGKKITWKDAVQAFFCIIRYRFRD